MNKILKAAIRHYAYWRMGEDIAVLAAGIGLGAGLMYLCDPDRGRARRSRMIGEATGLLHHGEITIAKHGKDLANRMRGLAARAAAEVVPEGAVEDDILIERVRSRMGHLSPHPHEVEVQVRRGVVTLKSKLARADRRRILEEIRSVPGVKRVKGHFWLPQVVNPGVLIGFAAGVAAKARFPELQTK